MNATRRLALGVIHQALDDLVAEAPLAADATAYGQIREQAHLFFFGQGNGWRESRALWAGILDLSSDAITQAGRAKLQEPPNRKVERKAPVVLPSVEDILALGPTISLTNLQAKFNLDKNRALSCIAKLRERGFKVTVTARNSGVYTVVR